MPRVKSHHLLAALLFLLSCALFWQLPHHQFINYDDNTYITANAQVKAGLTWQGVQWAFSTSHDANWFPLTWLSHMLDVQLFGLDAGRHHLVALLLHGINAALLFLLLHRLTGRVWRSAFVAALFAIHPLHVESVAWAAERKDLLSGLFWMLTLLAYCRYLGKPRLSRYLLLFAALAAGLMAKPMLVTLPFVLLLLDYWPLRRLTANGGELSLRRAIIEKLPLFGLSATSCVVTYLVQKSGGAVARLDDSSAAVNVANAALSYLRYLEKTVWPSGLAVFYPHPHEAALGFPAVAAALLLLAVTIVAVRFGRRAPYLPVGWFWYLGTMVPVIGLVRVGSQAMADRYTYLPLIGIFILAAWGGAAAAERLRIPRTAIVAAAVIPLLLLCGVTWRQLGYWQDSATLFARTAAVTTNNPMAHHMLASALADQGKNEEAIPHYLEALRLRPDYVKAQYNLALAYSDLKEDEKAIAAFRQALALDPGDPDAHGNLGALLAEKSRYMEAIAEYREALRLRPDDAFTRHNLAQAYRATGSADLALQEFSRALQLRPDHPGILLNYAVACEADGKLDQAMALYRKLLLLQPGDARVHNGLGLALLKAGLKTEAAAEFGAAVRLDPNQPEFTSNLRKAATAPLP